MIGLKPLAEVLALNSPDVEIGEEPRTVAEVLDAKRADAGYPRLLAEIRARGITVPVWVLDGDYDDYTRSEGVSTDPDLVARVRRLLAAGPRTRVLEGQMPITYRITADV